MGKISIRNGIGFSERSGAIFIDMSAATTTSDIQKDRLALTPTIPIDMMPSMPWSPWGKNNLLPIEMACDIENCLLQSIVDMQSIFGICNGPQAVVTELDPKTGQETIKSYVNDTEINDFMENNDLGFHGQAWIADQLAMGQGVCRYALNRKKDPQIIRIERHDVAEFRYAKMNVKGVIEDLWFAPEWEKVRGSTDKRAFTIPNLSHYNPVADLQNKVKNGRGNEYAITFRRPGWLKHYYSVPLWYAALKWVKIAQGVPEMKAAIFENSLHVKYVVIIHDTYWTKSFGPDWAKYSESQQNEKKQLVYDDISKWLVGSKNAYKSIFTTGYRSPDGTTYTDIEIKPVEDFQKDGKLLPDSAAANSEIAFAMHFNLSLFGGNQKDGPYAGEKGGSSVREAGLMQVIMMEPIRQNIMRMLNIVAKFNKWTERIPGLKFIIPATSLSTLDTGSGTKPIVTGSPQTTTSDGPNQQPN